MRDGTPQIRSLGRTLSMLESIIADGGRGSVSGLARQIGMPIATAHRQVTTLVTEGYLTPSGRGRHVAGSRLLGLLHRLDQKQVVANVAVDL
jgi:IclR family transcriptional regulator, acetate operon repressor